MNPTLRNILSVIAGLVIGGAINMGIIMLSSSIIPPPEGSDLTTEEGLKAAMHLMQPKHFLMPFLAHALGTLVGAFAVTKLAANNTIKFALIIGILNFIGGAFNVAMLPSPLWFSILDLAVAYFPMAYLGWIIGGKGQK